MASFVTTEPNAVGRTPLAQKKYEECLIDLPDDVAVFLSEGIRDILTIYDEETRTGELGSLAVKYLNRAVTLLKKKDSYLPTPLQMQQPEETPVLELKYVDGGIAASLYEFDIPRIFNPNCYPIGELKKMPGRPALEQVCLSLIYMHHRTLLETCYIAHAKANNPRFLDLGLLPELCALHTGYDKQVGPSIVTKRAHVTNETMLSMLGKWEQTFLKRYELAFCLFFGIQPNQIYLAAKDKTGFIDPTLKLYLQNERSAEQDFLYKQYSVLLSYELSYYRLKLNIKDLEVMAHLPHERGRRLIVELLVQSRQLPESALAELYSDDPVKIPGTAVSLSQIQHARYARLAAAYEYQPQIEQLRKDKAEQLEQIQALLSIIEEYKTHVKELESKIATIELLGEPLTTKATKQKKTPEQKEIAKLRQELQQLKKKVDALPQNEPGKELKQARTQLQDSQKAGKEKDREIKELRKEQQTALAEKDQLQGKVAGLQTQIGQLTERVNKLAAQNKEHKASLQTERKKLADANKQVKSLEASQRKTQGLEGDLKDRDEKIQDLEAEATGRTRLIKELITQKAAQEELLTKQKANISELVRLVNSASARHDEMTKLAVSLKDAKQTYDEAIAQQERVCLETLRKKQCELIGAREEIEILERGLEDLTRLLLATSQERDDAEQRADTLDHTLMLMKEVQQSGRSIVIEGANALSQMAELITDNQILRTQQQQVQTQLVQEQQTSLFYKQLADQQATELQLLRTQIMEMKKPNRGIANRTNKFGNKPIRTPHAEGSSTNHQNEGK